MDRQAWLAERRKGIGSSDAAAICGMSPYRLPVEVYLDKLGLLPEQDSPAMEWGRRLEPLVASVFSEKTHQGLAAGGFTRHPALSWMLATPDYLIPPMGAILECKTARSAEGWGEPGTDQVPEGYLLQVQHQLAVLGAEQGFIAVLIGGQDFRWYSIPRRQELIDLLAAIEGAFWRRVQERRPPELDWSDPRTPDLVNLLHRPQEGSSMELPAHCLPLVGLYEAAGAQIAQLERERKAAKGHIIEAMEYHAEARLPDGRRLRRKLVQKDAYTVKASSYVDFRILKGGKERE